VTLLRYLIARRLTPAQAGRTPILVQAVTGATAHPRAGGADGTSGERTAYRFGSPPRRRGGRREEAEDPPGIRLTPAQAGRTRT